MVEGQRDWVCSLSSLLFSHVITCVWAKRPDAYRNASVRITRCLRTEVIKTVKTPASAHFANINYTINVNDAFAPSGVQGGLHRLEQSGLHSYNYNSNFCGYKNNVYSLYPSPVITRRLVRSRQLVDTPVPLYQHPVSGWTYATLGLKTIIPSTGLLKCYLIYLVIYGFSDINIS